MAKRAYVRFFPSKTRDLKPVNFKVFPDAKDQLRLDAEVFCKANNLPCALSYYINYMLFGNVEGLSRWQMRVYKVRDIVEPTFEEYTANDEQGHIHAKQATIDRYVERKKLERAETKAIEQEIKKQKDKENEEFVNNMFDDMFNDGLDDLF